MPCPSAFETFPYFPVSWLLTWALIGKHTWSVMNNMTTNQMHAGVQSRYKSWLAWWTHGVTAHVLCDSPNVSKTQAFHCHDRWTIQVHRLMKLIKRSEAGCNVNGSRLDQPWILRLSNGCCCRSGCSPPPLGFGLNSNSAAVWVHSGELT